MTVVGTVVTNVVTVFPATVTIVRCVVVVGSAAIISSVWFSDGNVGLVLSDSAAVSAITHNNG